jgi:hypothetical protein
LATSPSWNFDRNNELTLRLTLLKCSVVFHVSTVVGSSPQSTAGQGQPLLNHPPPRDTTHLLWSQSPLFRHPLGREPFNKWPPMASFS